MARKPDPGDYASWEEWQEARERAGQMPDDAKPVPVAILLVVVVGVIAWVVAGRLGGTLDEEVLREGSAEITGDCYAQLDHRACPATVTWDDGDSEKTEVRADRDLDGTVPVEEHETFEVRRGAGDRERKSMRNTPIAWSADHRPTGKPYMFPAVFGGSMLGAFVLAGFVIALGSRWVRRRSRARWARARGNR